MKERRKDQRKSEETRVLIETLPTPGSSKSQTFYALTQDVSLGGARIRTDKYFPVGTRLRVSLTLSRIREIIRLDAEVRWISPLFEGELYDMGVEFDHKVHGDIMTLIRHIFGIDASTVPSPEKEEE